jgi:aspartate racemase
MKTIGIIGGIGPESTIDYYRSLTRLHAERRPEAGSASIIINSIDFKQMLRLIAQSRLPELVELLSQEVRKLHAAGSDFGLLAANAPHIVFDELARNSPIPLISIVEATCDEACKLSLKRVGLLGARFTMQASFYPDLFARKQIRVLVPSEEEQAYVHEKYFGELVKGLFLAETRERLTEIVARMAQKDAVQAVILGGTELPLILHGGEAAGIPLLDTTQIHVRAALDRSS